MRTASSRSAHSWNIVATAAVMLAGLLMGQHLFPLASAGAQVPDSGAQRNDMIVELRESNRKLAEIVSLLREIRDNAKPAGAKPAPRGVGEPKP